MKLFGEKKVPLWFLLTVIAAFIIIMGRDIYLQLNKPSFKSILAEQPTFPINKEVPTLQQLEEAIKNYSKQYPSIQQQADTIRNNILTLKGAVAREKQLRGVTNFTQSFPMEEGEEEK